MAEHMRSCGDSEGHGHNSTADVYTSHSTQWRAAECDVHYLRKQASQSVRECVSVDCVTVTVSVRVWQLVSPV